MWQSSWRGEHPNHRGANMFTIDRSTCTLMESRNFDTWADSGNAVQLRDYIQGLSDGTVLVGISCDEASYHLDAAEATLNALGAYVSYVGYHGAWAFVAEKGDPSKTILDKVPTAALALVRDPRVTASLQTGAF